MKVLVSCDDYCYKLGSSFFLRDFGHILANRYLSVFDEIRFVLRTKEVFRKEDLGKYNIEVTDKRIEIYPIVFFQGPLEYFICYFPIRKKLKNVVLDCDFAILRLPSTVAFAVWSQIVANKLVYATEIVFDCKDACNSSVNLLHRFLWYRMHYKQKKACNNAVGVSCVTSRYLQQRYFPINKNAIVTNYSSIEMPKSFFFEERKYPNKTSFNIIHVANQVQFNSRKGHNEIILALKLVRDQGYDITLTFVGEDYLGGQKKLTQLAESLSVGRFVGFTGFLSQERMRECLISADIAVLPTKAEGLPRVVIEAMALGLPCITTNVSGNSELIDERFLIKYTDVDAIVANIVSLISDPVLYEQVSSRNFQCSHEYCSEILNNRRNSFYADLKSKITKY